MDFGSISRAEWITIGWSLAGLIFGGGLIWRLFGRRGVSRDEIGEKKSDTKSVFTISVKGNPYLAKVKIGVGDYKQFEWGSHSVKISVMDIIKENFKTVVGEMEVFGVELDIDTGGGLIYGGKCTKESGVNRYKVPAIVSNFEEAYSLYFYHSDKNYLKFFRVFVEHINTHAKEITLNVFFFKKMSRFITSTAK